MEDKLKAILKQLEEQNPKLKFELTLKPICGKWGGWISFPYDGKNYLLYSTAAGTDAIVFCGNPDGKGDYSYPLVP